MPYPEGESSARFRSIHDAEASLAEHFSQGIDTEPASMVRIRASGVVWIAFAITGFVLLCKISSEMLAPGGNDLIKMFKDYLSNFASQTRCALVFKILGDVEALGVQPIFAFCLSLHGVHVNWLVALVRVKIEPPTLYVENSGHRFATPL